MNSNSNTTNYIPWIEKYRPKKLDDLIGNKDIIKHFKEIVKKGSQQHMLLTGQPGVGKTSAVICLAKELLGSKFNDGFLELNASDQRGIETVRSDIKNFCEKLVILPDNRKKIIFLDEVEAMTDTAQKALLRRIEKSSKTTCFILACNSSAGLILPMISRCTLRRFLKVSNEDIEGLLCKICELEDIKKTDEGLKTIAITSQGDVRYAINCLQTVFCAYGSIDNENVTSAIDKPNYLTICKLFDVLLSDDDEAFTTSLEIMNELLMSGFNGLDILKLMFSVIKDYDIDEYIKLKYLEEIGKTETYLIRGSDDEVQLTAVIARLCLQKYEVLE